LRDAFNNAKRQLQELPHNRSGAACRYGSNHDTCPSVDPARSTTIKDATEPLS
jgi:hypothetical protein